MMEEKFYNALALATRADYRKLKELKDKNASWETAWNSIPAGERRIVDPNNAFEALSQLHIKLLLLSDANFPEPLKEIHCPPLGIYVRGEIGRAQTPSLAIVGTRKSTEEGKETARAFARELASRGVRIVSGLALGIDAAAHEGALDAKGHTIAVLGNGLDQLYPRNNERIAKGIIASGGAIISEYPLGTPPLPHHFLERNRIVSGLTQGVLVIEAPKESGALATARFALEQNRDVFVVPGPVKHPNFQGSHELIKAGAALVTNPSDILDALRLTERAAAQPLFDNEEERAIVTTLKASARPLTVDDIAERTALDAQHINKTISFLLMKNAVQETDNGYSV